jgi:hypothetical protein
VSEWPQIKQYIKKMKSINKVTASTEINKTAPVPTNNTRSGASRIP